MPALRTALLAAALIAALALASTPASAATTCEDQTIPPTAAFSSAPATVEPGAEVSFDASASTGGHLDEYHWTAADQSCEPGFSGPVAIASYSWDFGDGTTAFTTNSAVSHSFARGSYTVKLTVHAGGAGSDSVTHTVATAWHV